MPHPASKRFFDVIIVGRRAGRPVRRPHWLSEALLSAGCCSLKRANRRSSGTAHRRPRLRPLPPLQHPLRGRRGRTLFPTASSNFISTNWARPTSPQFLGLAEACQLIDETRPSSTVTAWTARFFPPTCGGAAAPSARRRANTAIRPLCSHPPEAPGQRQT